MELGPDQTLTYSITSLKNVRNVFVAAAAAAGNIWGCAMMKRAINLCVCTGSIESFYETCAVRKNRKILDDFISAFNKNFNRVRPGRWAMMIRCGQKIWSHCQQSDARPDNYSKLLWIFRWTWLVVGERTMARRTVFTIFEEIIFRTFRWLISDWFHFPHSTYRTCSSLASNSQWTFMQIWNQIWKSE